MGLSAVIPTSYTFTYRQPQAQPYQIAAFAICFSPDEAVVRLRQCMKLIRLW